MEGTFTGEKVAHKGSVCLGIIDNVNGTSG